MYTAVQWCQRWYVSRKLDFQLKFETEKVAHKSVGPTVRVADLHIFCYAMTFNGSMTPRDPEIGQGQDQTIFKA